VRRLGAISIGLTLVLLGAVGVSTRAHGVSAPAARNCSASSLARATSTDKPRYAPGETVHVGTSITNTSNRTCGVDFGPCVSATIRAPGGTLVWSAVPLNALCAQFIVHADLAPGRSVSRSWTWDQHVCLYVGRCPGRQVGPGTYVAQGQWGPGSVTRPTSFVINGVK
jgi:hypothetical protein